MSFTNIIQVLPDAVGASINSAEIEDGSIVNADIDAAAAIALSKLATTTVSRALVSTAGGVIGPATTTATEIGYVNGVTSAIQTQFTNKQAASANLTALAAVTAAADNTYASPTSITISKGLITAIS
jgi:hypothetical protein